MANTAESLLKTERATQERWRSSSGRLEAEHLALKGDLGFFERLLPPRPAKAWRCAACRPSRSRRASCAIQMLVMQSGKAPPNSAVATS